MTALRHSLPLLALAAIAMGAAAPAPSLLGGKGLIDAQTSPTGSATFNPKTCTGVLTGGAKITQGAARLQADAINMTGSHPDASSSDCSWTHVEATGHVYYVTPDRTVRADKGIYDSKTQIAEFTGDVTGVDGANVINGPHATLNTATGQLTIDGGVHMVINPDKPGAPAPAQGR